MNKFSFCAALLLASHFVSASEKPLGSSPTTVTFLTARPAKDFILSNDGKTVLERVSYSAADAAKAEEARKIANQEDECRNAQMAQDVKNAQQAILAPRSWNSADVKEAIINKQNGLLAVLSRGLRNLSPHSALTMDTGLLQNERWGKTLLGKIVLAGGIATVGIAGAIFNVAIVKASLPRVSLGSIAEYTGEKVLRFFRA